MELENSLEQEQESLVNRLWKRMDKLESEKRSVLACEHVLYTNLCVCFPDLFLLFIHSIVSPREVVSGID